MSETSQMREIDPQADLKTYANVAPHAYQRALQQFLDIEKDAEIRSTRGLLERSGIDQIKRNDKIPFIPDCAAQPLSQSSDVIISFEPDDPTDDYYIQREHGIYEDHRVALLCYDDVDDDEFEIIEGTIDFLRPHSLTVTLDIENTERHRTRTAIESCEQVGLVSVYNPFMAGREREAIKSLPKISDFWEIITGQRPVSFGFDAAESSEKFDEALYENEMQEKAIDRALRADDVYCIQGPPGTGKSRVIREIVRRFVAAGYRALVVAETNTAIDNILIGPGQTPSDNSLMAHAIGMQDSSTGLTVARNNREQSKRKFVQNSVSGNTSLANAVLSTNNSAASLVEHGQEFDVVISDEAAQPRKTSTFIPLQLAERVIFVGDYQQLHATRQSNKEYDGDQRHLSVFEHLYDGLYPEDIGVQLDVQYRMVPDLMEFSQRFYEHQIETGSDHSSKMSQPIGLIDIDIPEGEESVETSKQNQLEATATALQVKLLLRRFDPDEIGVIAAYSAQEELIRTQLDIAVGGQAREVQVATIDRFQGSEKEAIVVSFTRSNERGNVGFLSGEEGSNRLNVALTRARQYCALIGDWNTLRSGNKLYDELYDSVDRRFRVKNLTREQLLNQWNKWS